MNFLHWLAERRTPFGDAFFAAITQLGDETLFIVAGLLFFWCINKRQGYFLLFVGFLGTVANQFLKLFFRIPRPWVRDPSLTVVGNAKEAAGGYSFPSGHTQTAVGVYGGIARFARRWWVRILCLAVCALVGLSRMYLGVHTPLDVGVSLAVATVLVLGLYPLVGWTMQSPRRMRVLFSVCALLAVGFLAYVTWFPFPADIDAENYASGVKNAYKILGCFVGLWLAFELDTRVIRFDIRAVWWAQALKLVLGLLPLLAIKAGLKAPLSALFGGAPAADGVRYFLIAVFAGCVWPLTFRFFARLGKK
ncbi:MAG: phosphatase PAP2 family protein [Ruminococcaceae bacterium]|nr:phosphatase PAP2 family protein [Oscillospiraceae bacterium]